jgi:hypothetical protein
MRWRRNLTLSLALGLANLVAFSTGRLAAQESGQDSRKSPAAALALSLLVPGAGQVYNGQYLKGAGMFGGVALTSWAIVLTVSDVLELDDDASGTEVHVLGAIGMGAMLWSWIDAPLSARAINRRIELGGAALEVGPLGFGTSGPPGVTLLRVNF